MPLQLVRSQASLPDTFQRRFTGSKKFSLAVLVREDAMQNESPTYRMQEIWQCQPVEGIKMSVEEIRKRSTKFEKKIFWRNVREYVAGAIAIVLLGLFMARSHNLLDRSAFALLIAGMAYVMYQLHRRGAAKSMPASAAVGPSLDFYRRELKRQRDLTSTVWSWY